MSKKYDRKGYSGNRNSKTRAQRHGRACTAPESLGQNLKGQVNDG